MLGSEILDVCIGLIFVYLTLSLLGSAVSELIEAWLKRRATGLEKGLRELLGDNEGNGIVGELYNHPLIAGLFPGAYTPGKLRPAGRLGRPNLPSYIPARDFALALVDLAKSREMAAGSLTAAIDGLPNARVRGVLSTLLTQANGDLAQLYKSVETWYENGLERVSGWYKRQTQVILLVLGVVLAAAFNADTVGLARALAQDDALRTSAVEATGRYLEEATKAQCNAADNKPPANCSALEEQLERDLIKLSELGLPLGWQAGTGSSSWTGWVIKGLGWLLTGVAVSLGAPFWFDLLDRIMTVRSTVKPPASKVDA